MGDGSSLMAGSQPSPTARHCLLLASRVSIITPINGKPSFIN
jgi:hypothetical protein